MEVERELKAKVGVEEAVVEQGLEGKVEVEEVAVEQGLEAKVEVEEVAVEQGLEAKVEVEEVAVEQGLEGKVEVEEVAVEQGLESKVEVEQGLEAKVEVEEVAVEQGLETKVAVEQGLEAKVEVEEVAVEQGLEAKVEVEQGLEAKVEAEEVAVEQGLEAKVEVEEVAVEQVLEAKVEQGLEATVEVEQGLEAKVEVEEVVVEQGSEEKVGVEEVVVEQGLVAKVGVEEVVVEQRLEPKVKVEKVTVKVKEEEKKKSVEEIGQEEAWFKKGGKDQVEVSVAPGGRWSRFKTYSTIQRTLEIWGFVFSFVFRVWLSNQKFSYKGGMTEEKKRLRRITLAKWLKENILRLGPTFIKLGQQFSTRADILPQEYVDQLSELQDQVPPFPSDTAISVVEEELGGRLGDIFDRFDYEPIAAASLGQVHRARLKGQEVVVKVQRPGLKDLFDIDLKNLRVIAEYLQKLDPKSDGAKRDWVAIYDECASVLYQEIDYTKEAANAELFASNFKAMDYVKVPRIFWEYTTPQVLTMEYVPGIKINRIEALDQLGVDRKRLGRYAVESYLEQILSHGFFHADPHPGNIAVDDVNGGRLIFYDFGMMGSISSNIREGLLEVFYGVYEKDPDKVLQAMIQMGVLVPTGDMTAVRRTALFFLNSFEERLAAQMKEREAATAELGFKKPLTKEERMQKKKQRLAAIGEDLLAIAADQPFRFPATFTFVVRAFSVLDGIGKGLDPRFDITEIARPYALELLKFREAGVEVVVKDMQKRWNRQSRAFYNLFRQADRVDKLVAVIERLEKGDLKLRVRALESERAFQRVATVQKTIGSAVVAGTLLNLATMLHLHAVRVPAIAAYALCALFGLQALVGVIKVKKLDERERLITGTA